MGAFKLKGKGHLIKKRLTHRFESALVDHGEGPMADEVFGVKLVDANRGE